MNIPVFGLLEEERERKQDLEDLGRRGNKELLMQFMSLKV